MAAELRGENVGHWGAHHKDLWAERDEHTVHPEQHIITIIILVKLNTIFLIQEVGNRVKEIERRKKKIEINARIPPYTEICIQQRSYGGDVVNIHQLAFIYMAILPLLANNSSRWKILYLSKMNDNVIVKVIVILVLHCH